MASVAEFSAENFDPVAYVNSLCAQKRGGEHEGTLDKFLSEMEMRLQLSAEEIEAGLQDSSNQALRRIPYAVQEIYRLQVGAETCNQHFPCKHTHIHKELGLN